MDPSILRVFYISAFLVVATLIMLLTRSTTSDVQMSKIPACSPAEEVQRVDRLTADGVVERVGDAVAEELSDFYLLEEAMAFRKVKDRDVAFFVFDTTAIDSRPPGTEAIIPFIRAPSSTEAFVRTALIDHITTPVSISEDQAVFRTARLVDVEDDLDNPDFGRLNMRTRLRSVSQRRAGPFNKCNLRNAKVLDVGANSGYYGLIAAAYGCDVDFYEPQPQCGNWINAQILINNFQANARLISNIIANESTTATTRVRTGCWGTWDTKDTERLSAPNPLTNSVEDTVTVKSVRLDDVYFHRSGLTIVFMKMDVEGFEIPALASMDKMLRARRVERFIVEITPKKWQGIGLSCSDGVAHLKRIMGYGYTAHCASFGSKAMTVGDMDWFITRAVGCGASDGWIQTDCQFGVEVAVA